MLIQENNSTILLHDEKNAGKNTVASIDQAAQVCSGPVRLEQCERRPAGERGQSCCGTIRGNWTECVSPHSLSVFSSVFAPLCLTSIILCVSQTILVCCSVGCDVFKVFWICLSLIALCLLLYISFALLKLAWFFIFIFFHFGLFDPGLQTWHTVSQGAINVYIIFVSQPI